MRWINNLLRPVVSPRSTRRTRLRVESLEGREVPASVAGVVFTDVNGDGLHGTGDTGISGITVKIFDGEREVATTTTGASGGYRFASLVVSTDYQIQIDTTQVKLANLTPTPEDLGDDDAVDSDFILDGDLATVDFSTDDGTSTTPDNQTYDAGFISATANLTLGGQVFNDADDSGNLDDGETSVAGVTVELLGGTSDVVQATTTTDASGAYKFTGLVADDYRVRLAPSNFMGTGKLVGLNPSTTFSSDPNDDIAGDSNGEVSGTLGSGGTIVTEPITLSTGDESIDDGDTNPNTNLSVDFGVIGAEIGGGGTASLAGRVFLDYDNSGAANGPDSGVVGVTITLSGGPLSAALTTQTAADGSFSFTGLSAGTYSIEETQPTTPGNRSGKNTVGSANGNNAIANVISGITIADAAAATGYTFAEVPLLSTGGKVFVDANANNTFDTGEAGIAGVTITLTGTNVIDGAITAKTATTDSSGNYTFTGLTPGTYALAETQPASNPDGGEQNGTPAAATVTNDNFAGINLSTAIGTGGFNFGEAASTTTGTASLAGAVFVDANSDGTRQGVELGIAGVSIHLTGTVVGSAPVDRTTTTGTDGSFSFTGLAAGTYVLTETQPASNPDGVEKAGTAGGSIAVNNTISGIVLTGAQAGTGYLFAELAAATPPPAATSDLLPKVALSANTIKSGNLVTITATVKNRGTAAATATAATINLNGLEFVSTPSSNYNSTTHTWSVGNIAAGATATLSITARVPSVGTFAPALQITASTPEMATAATKVASAMVIGTAPTVPPPPAPAAPTGVPKFWFLSSGWFGGAGRVIAPVPTPPGNPPAAPTVALAAGSDTGTVGDNSTSLPAVTLTGTTTAGATVRLLGRTATTTADANGSYSFAGVPLTLGSNNFTIRAANGGGTTSTAQTITRVDAPPTAPTLTLAPGSDTGTSGDRSTNLATVTLNGATTGGAAVTLVETGATTTAAADGTFSFTSVALAVGSNTFTARATNSAGTTTGTATTFTRVTAAGTPPTAPTLDLAAASDTGTVGDKSTNLATVTLTGTTSQGAGVTLIETGATTSAAADGTFSFTNVPLVLGANTFTVSAVNPGGTTPGTATTFTRVAATTNATPTLKTALSPVTLTGTATKTIDLAGSFDDTDITNTLVKFDTSAGNVNIELFDKQAPKSVANFLNYVNSGAYTNSIFHRSAKNGNVPFVLQGGGFTFQPGVTPTIATIVTDPAVQNEPDIVNRSNLKGTLAMAKLGGNPDSATDQFFFNLGNNSANLDAQNGGFTVFGKLVSAADQTVVDTLAALPTQNQGNASALPANEKGIFTEIPLSNYSGTAFPTDTAKAHYAIINGVSITQQTEKLTYSIVSNLNPAAATATIVNNRLTISGVAAGTTTITVRATDKTGAFVDTNVTVTVS